MLPAYLDLLAQLPSGVYLNPWKLLGVTIAFTIWALFAQWIDKDTVAVNTYRILWNLVISGVGAAGLLLMLLVPNFAIGFPAGVGIYLIAVTVYVFHRNGLVEDEDKVFTPAHIAKVMREGFSGKKGKKQKEVKEKVRLQTINKKSIAIPEEEVEREQYRLTQDLLFDALFRRATYIELAPAGQAAKINYTIDAITSEAQKLERAEADAIILFLKKSAGMNIEERRKPQTGKLLAVLGETKMDLHIKTDGSTAGEKMLIRVVSAEKTFKVTDLGFTDKQMETVRAIMNTPRGVILVSSPPGNGLTTTIYSLTRSHDAFLQNIQTVEYAKDLDIDNVTQNVFEPGGDKTFAGDLQKLFRADPDIVIIPEVRDSAAAALIAQQGSEKQKIYVGISNAADVLDALRKWMKLVGDSALAAKGLLGIMNQRLIRKLCAACKEPYKPDAASLKKMNMPADQVLYRQPQPQFDKHGNPILCQACQGTGYSGLTAIFDVFMVDDGMRDVIRRAKSLEELKAYIVQRGGLALQQQALAKVLAGTTSIAEVKRATAPPAPAGEAARPAAKPPAPKAPPPSGPAAQTAR